MKDKEDKPEYWRSTELDNIAKMVRGRWHEHLNEAEVSFLMTKKAMARAGKAIIGKARRATGLIKFFSRSDYVIVFSDDEWQKLSRAQREAAVDHELCHCVADNDDDGNRIWGLRGHDLEEFARVVDRHGLWKEDVKHFGEAVARQMELPLGQDRGKKGKGDAQEQEPARPL